jgi:hypothetical protein
MQLDGAGGRALIYKKGLAGIFKQIIVQEGLLGLYRGIVPEYYKVIPSIGIVFVTYEFMKRILQPQSWNDSQVRSLKLHMLPGQQRVCRTSHGQVETIPFCN